LAGNNSVKEERTMSALEEATRACEQVISAAAKGDFGPFITALDDKVEIFDHVPYRFEDKQSFLEYLQSAMAGNESTTFAFHQPSLRAITDDVAVVNAYDRMAIAPKGGGPTRVQCGRTTMVLAKKSGAWKIVSAHFSALPSE
jgi:ketosteroid isomerase-like protein